LPVSADAAATAGLAKYTSTKEFDPGLNTAKEKGKPRPYEADFYAGDIPKVGDQKGEVMGLAVFDGTKMIGKMDGAQATNYLMVTGEYKYAFVTIDDPKVPGEVVVLSVSQGRKPEYKIDLADSKPKISVKLNFEADFASIQSGVNYEDNKQKPLIEKTASDYLKRGVSKFLELTAKEYHSDICGFGREVRKQFLTWKEREDSKWLSRYKDAAFDVSVDVKIRRPGQIIRSAPFLPSDEKEISQ
jgi:spore germination protein KC